MSEYKIGEILTKEELEKRKLQAQMESMAFQQEEMHFKKKQKKKFLMIVSIIIIIILLLRIIFGPIIINLGYHYYDNRFYKIQLNDKVVLKGGEKREKITIIPFLLYLSLSNTNNALTKSMEKDFIINNFEKKAYKLDIIVYDCYPKYENKNMEKCINLNKKYKGRKQVKDIENKEIEIFDNKNSKTLYEGKMINDITKYINKKGEYFITITAKENKKLFVKKTSIISFSVINE